MKYPPTDITNKITLAHHTNARHTAGRFAFMQLLAEILFQLTKVNNQRLFSYKPISCEHVVFAILMLENTKVNKMGLLMHSLLSQFHGISWLYIIPKQELTALKNHYQIVELANCRIHHKRNHLTNETL